VREAHAGQHGADHLRELHGDRLERDGGGDAPLAHQRIERRPASGKIEGPQETEECLEGHERAVAAAAPGEDQEQGESRDHAERLREEQDAPAMDAIGDHPRERAEDHHGRGAHEHREPNHEGRARERKREPAQHHQIHPAGGVDAEAGDPEAPVGALAEDLREGEACDAEFAGTRRGPSPRAQNTFMMAPST